MVPRGPRRDVLGPIARRVGTLGVQRREPVVDRDVARDSYPDGAEKVERATGEHQRRRHLAPGDHSPNDEPKASHCRPEEHRHKEDGATARMLIDCIAEIPSSGFSRLNAAITNVEKAKKTPATSPQPRAVTSVAA